MITKSTIIDRIEIERDGTVLVRLGLLLSENGVELDSKWHRTVVPPGVSTEEQFALVNAHLSSMGRDQVSTSEINRIKQFTALAHTQEAIATYQAKLTASTNRKV